MELETESANNKCMHCKKVFAFKQSLNKHIRNVHGLGLRDGGLKCPNKDCGDNFHTLGEIRLHIANCHKVAIEIEELKFQTFQDFKLWKEVKEKELQCQYVMKQSVKKLASGQLVRYYSCFRSGSFVTKSTGKRQLKSTGSRKISGCCPSSMHVTYTESEVNVKFWKTHYGHDHDIGRMFLTFEEKNEIACKLKQGATLNEVLDDVRDSLSSDDLQRIHLLKKKDIYNIARDFKVIAHNKLHEKDALSVKLWVKNLQAAGDDNPVGYFKEQGQEDYCEPELKNSLKLSKIEKTSQHQVLSKTILGEKLKHLHSLIVDENIDIDEKVLHNMNSSIDKWLDRFQTDSFQGKTNEPPNKKIKHQLRFSSTKNPRAKKKFDKTNCL